MRLASLIAKENFFVMLASHIRKLRQAKRVAKENFFGTLAFHIRHEHNS